jgi:MerR family transcriptional regulator, thiopeptide resistance regulator
MKGRGTKVPGLKPSRVKRSTLEQSEPTEFLSVADCARRTGLTARALRVYERHGLIDPPRSAKGWRMYGRADVVRLNAIIALKALGLTLGQIREALASKPPELRRVLHMQLGVWQRRRLSADEGVALVRAAIAGVDTREHLSLDDLCGLAKRMDMQNLRETRRRVMNEQVSAEEERAWATWWSQRPEPWVKAMREYSLAQAAVWSELRRLQAAGATATAMDVQRIVKEFTANLLRYGTREYMLEMFTWNAEIARKIVGVGERVTAEKVAAQQPAPGPDVFQFFRMAVRASPRGNSENALLQEARSLVAAGMAPDSAQSKALAQRFAAFCTKYELGDPVIYARWACAMGMTASQSGELSALSDEGLGAWRLLIAAVR